MPPVPDWAKPMTLTSPYGNLLINQQTASGIYLLRPDGCGFNITVRSTKDNVPQGDGFILHRRFLTGSEMPLAIQLWEDTEHLACDELAEEMIDLLTLHLRGLLNAGDNEGRLSWEISSGGNVRMLDDIRLLVYPSLLSNDLAYEITTTVDSQYPYAQDLTPQLTTIGDGNSDTLANTGSANYFPVFKVYGPTSGFTLTNATTVIEFSYDDSQPGAVAIGAGDYAEIDTFRNTIFLNGSGANLKAGVVELSSDYWSLIVGNNVVDITGADVDILWAPAYG